MPRITNPEAKKLAGELILMEIAVAECERKAEDLLMAGSDLPETAEGDEDRLRAVRTATAAGTALLSVAVAMLIHPGRRLSDEQDQLAAIREAASEKPCHETILAMCRLLRANIAEARTPMGGLGQTKH